MNAISKFRIISLIFCLVATSGQVEASESQLNLADAYAKHWFSIDSKEEPKFSLTQTEQDGDYAISTLRFISDDGHAVNGKLIHAKSLTENTKTKLALLVHPMGVDQEFWFTDKLKRLIVKPIAETLIKKGYVVLTLDARLHGERAKKGFGWKDLIGRAHSEEPRIYIDTIIGTVRDYRIAFNWAKSQFPIETTFVGGYSMGAQMAVLFTSFEPSVNHLLAMVPPYVSNGTFPVAPRHRVQGIHNTEVLWLAGKKDKYSSQDEVKQTFHKIASSNKELVWFDSGHFLPKEAVSTAAKYVDALN